MVNTYFQLMSTMTIISMFLILILKLKFIRNQPAEIQYWIWIQDQDPLQ